MKKSFFLSILAVGALVAGCAKSEIVDTKYNEEISFETYLGRDAQTKVAAANLEAIQNTNYPGIGIYGFYTGQNTLNDESEANLWVNLNLKYTTESVWSYDQNQVKYWTNATDYYSFLAYAPYNGTGLVVSTEEKVKNPTVTYTVPEVLANQIDLLYSNTPAVDGKNGHVNMTKAEVALAMKHALSRISITAKENHPEYTYNITALSLSGNFVKTNVFNLIDGKWAAVTETTTKETSPYNFSIVADNLVPAGDTPKSMTGEEYLMIIPANIAEAVLSVTYTTTYEGITSNPITKKVKVSQEFAQGTAYAINLAFEPNKDDIIKFTVTTVEGWGNEVSVGTDPTNPEQGE